VISLARIARQVQREGARWRLSPLIRDGKVWIVEYVPEIPPGLSRPGRLVVPILSPRVVLKLDNDAAMDAWSMVLRRRMSRQFSDFMRLVKNRSDRLRKEEQRILDQLKRDVRVRTEAKFIRSRTLFGPGIQPLEPGIFRGGR